MENESFLEYSQDMMKQVADEKITLSEAFKYIEDFIEDNYLEIK